jgi:hypothetical protein
VVIVISANSATSDLAMTPSGYTSANERYSNSTRDTNLSVAWKVMGGTPDTTVTCVGSGSATLGAAAVVHVFRGVDTGTPMDTTATVTGGTGSATPNPPTITPVTNGAIVVIGGSYSAASVDASFTVPTGFQTDARDASTDPGTACHVFGAFSETPWSSGAVDAGGWGSITGGAGDAWGAISAALRPAAAPAGNTSNFFHFIA